MSEQLPTMQTKENTENTKRQRHQEKKKRGKPFDCSKKEKRKASRHFHRITASGYHTIFHPRSFPHGHASSHLFVSLSSLSSSSSCFPPFLSPFSSLVFVLVVYWYHVLILMLPSLSLSSSSVFLPGSESSSPGSESDCFCLVSWVVVLSCCR